MQSWETTIHRIARELFDYGEWDTERCYELLAWALLRAVTRHPEWACAHSLALSVSLQARDAFEIVDELAKILVDGTPVERMVV